MYYLCPRLVVQYNDSDGKRCHRERVKYYLAQFLKATNVLALKKDYSVFKYKHINPDKVKNNRNDKRILGLFL